MSAKNNDNHNRFRSQTIAFRVSPEEDKQINIAVSLSGMTKQDYITHKLLDRTINVKYVYGERNVIDIKPEFACIDCGDWGSKGENIWKHNYSTSSLYTTTETYETGTEILEPITVSDAKWDDDAQNIIDNAGPKADYQDRFNKSGIADVENIVSIPDTKPNIPFIVGASAAGALVLAGIIAGTLIAIKRRKR